MKSRPVWVLAISIILGISSLANAHSILSREIKISGDYQAVMEVTADVPDPYEQFALTYTYLLLNKDATQYVSFDFAKVNFAKKRGGLIINAELDGPKNGLPGTELDVAMPSPGDYETEVTFFKNVGGKSQQLAKASFDFATIPLPKTTPTEASTTPAPPVPAPRSATLRLGTDPLRRRSYSRTVKPEDCQVGILINHRSWLPHLLPMDIRPFRAPALHLPRTSGRAAV